MNELVDKVLIILGSTVGGVSVSALLIFLFKLLFSKVNVRMQVKAITKELLENMMPEITKGVLEGIKDTTFKHSIEPVIVSNIQKLNEVALKDFVKEVARLEQKNKDVINILDKLSACFENSAIPQETKDALKEAIAQAKTEIEETVETEVVVEEPKKIEEPKKEIKKEKKTDVLL